MRIASVVSGTILGAVLVGCGDSSSPPIYGTWNVTKSEYVSVADTTQRVDLVAQGGSGAIDLNADASFEARLVAPGGAAETVTGTWSFTDDTFTLRKSGSSVVWTFDKVAADGRLTLTGADVEYDFDGNGMPEPATWSLTLTLAD